MDLLSVIALLACFLGSTTSQRDVKMPRITAITPSQLKDAGETVILACSVRDAENIPMEWVKLANEEKGQKTSKMIAFGEKLIIQDPRFSVRNFPNYKSLEISNLKATDVGTYQCRLGDNISNKVELLIRSHPVILEISTKSVMVKEGGTATLACLANGFPDPVVYWSRNENFRPQDAGATGNIIKIANVTKEDHGDYFCLAVNSLGENILKVHLDVVYPPVISEGSTTSTVVVRDGETATLACHAQGFPDPEIFWSRTPDFFPEQAEAFGEIVNVTQVTHTSRGSYYCLAANSAGSVRHRVDVEVEFQPIFLDTRSTVELVEGEPAVLNCSAIGYTNPKIYWSLKPNFLVSEATFEGDVLGVKHISKAHRGRYHCLGINSVGLTRKHIDVEIAYHPAFLEKNETVEYPEGSTAVLNCSASGYPVPKIYWSRQETFFASEAFHEGPILTLDDLRRGHTGKYYCLAKNSVSTSKKYIDVRVLFPPTFLDLTPVVGYPEGGQGVLNCSVEGYPLPQVYWGIKEDFTVEEATYNGSTFELPYVTKINRGRYFCLSENRLGITRKTIDVEVDFPPHVNLPSTLTSAFAGGDIVLECDVLGFPPPVISWIKNNMTLTNDGVFKITNKAVDSSATNSKLQIDYIEAGHFGFYECKAENKLGVDGGRVNLLQIESSRGSGLAPAPLSIVPTPIVRPREPETDKNVIVKQKDVITRREPEVVENKVPKQNAIVENVAKPELVQVQVVLSGRSIPTTTTPIPTTTEYPTTPEPFPTTTAPNPKELGNKPYPPEFLAFLEKYNENPKFKENFEKHLEKLDGGATVNSNA